MVDQNCAYCVEGELLAKFGIKICGADTTRESSILRGDCEGI